MSMSNHVPADLLPVFCAQTHTVIGLPATKPLTIHEQMQAKLAECIAFIEANEGADFDCGKVLLYLDEAKDALELVTFDDSWRHGDDRRDSPLRALEVPK